MDVIVSARQGAFQVRAFEEAPQTFAKADEALARAVTLAEEMGGGCVRLLAGEYPTTRPVVLRSRVRLVGSGRATRIVLHNREGAAAISAEEADAVEVADLAVIAGTTRQEAIGILFHHCGDCRLTGTFAKGFAEAGVMVRKNSFLCRVEGAVAADCGRGFHLQYLSVDGRGGDFLPSLLLGCSAYGGGVGFALEKSVVINLVGCMVHQTRSHGFLLWNHSNSVVLSGCRTFQIEGDAVHVDESHEFNATGNIFCWTRGDNIVLRRVSWATICGNNIIDAGVRDHSGELRNGVVIRDKCEGVQVTGNNVFNWGDQTEMKWGILEDGTGRKISVVANNINYFREGGYKLPAETTTEAYNVALGAPSYQNSGNPAYPDYTFTRLDRFIEQQ